jgi:hypothetical protein
MPYFSNQPGPTPSEDLPMPLSVKEKIKNKSDAIAQNMGKRKQPEDASGRIKQ